MAIDAPVNISSDRPPTRDDRLRAVGKLALGSILGYGVVVILTPFLTRLYSPADLGEFSVIAAVIGILPPLMTLGYPFGQLSTRGTSGALRLGVLSLVCAFFLTLTVLVGLLIWTYFGASIRAAVGTLAALLCGVLAALTTVGINWAIRRHNNTVAACSTFANLGGRGIFQTAFGFSFGGVGGLLLGEILGRASAWWIVERGVLRAAIRSMRRRPSALLRTAVTNLNYPLTVTPAVTLENLLIWLPAPIFAYCFQPEVGGLIVLVQRFASVPLTVANQSLATMFHREAREMMKSEPRRLHNSLKLMFAVAVLAFPPLYLLLASFGAPIAERVFGSAHWADAAFVAATLLPVYLAQFLCLFTDRILLILDRNLVKLKFLLLNALLLFLAVIAAKIMGWSWRGGLELFGLTQALGFAALFLFSSRILQRETSTAKGCSED